MSKDISKIIADWQYDPANPTARIVKGDDGIDKVQLRIDLGLIQMEINGRPDGRRPEGRESWLEYYEEQQEAFDAAHPDSASYELGGEDCERLWQEAVQYYHRYLSFWHLRLFDLCIRDTQRNLRLFNFVREHISDRRMVLRFDQWRPNLILMHTRAKAVPLLEKDKYVEAIKVIDAAIEEIEAFLDEYDQGHRADQCLELTELKRWHNQVVAAMEDAAARHSGKGSHIRKEQVEQISLEGLREMLKDAVEAEEFEEAARLRDEIRRLAAKSSEAE